MARRSQRGLLLGASLAALAALARPGAAQDLVNPPGTTVPAGFIKVDPGETFDNVYNFATVDGFDGPGIWVEGDGVVLGDVRNRGGGLIEIGGIFGSGLLLSGQNASIGDDLDNFGLIHIDVTRAAVGILAGGTGQHVGGDVANRGEGIMVVSAVNDDLLFAFGTASVLVEDVSAYGIVVEAGVTGIDDVANYGVIGVRATASAYAVAQGDANAFASADMLGSADAGGIFVSGTAIEGAVVNAGRLDVQAAAIVRAFATATGTTAVARVGNLSIAITASARGMQVLVDDVAGGVANVGTIDVAATAVLEGHAVASAAYGNVTAEIFQPDAIRWQAAAVGAGITVQDAVVVGGMLNIGTIDVEAAARVGLDMAAQAGTGGAYADIGGDGLFVRVSAYGGGVQAGDIGTIELGVANLGAIDVAANAALDLDAHADGAAFGLAFIFAASNVQLDAYASAYGLYLLDVGRIDGGVANAGDISVEAVANVDASVAAHADRAGAQAFIDSVAPGGGDGAHVFVTAEAIARGLAIESVTDLLGDMTNGGDIAAVANAGIALGVSAAVLDGVARAYIWSFESMYMHASASVVGVNVQVADLEGDLLNTGDVAVSGAASIEVHLDARGLVATAYLSADHTGLSIAANALAYGLAVGVKHVAGDVANSGDIATGASALVDVAVSAHASDGDAAVHLRAGSEMTLAAVATAYGLVVLVGEIDGGVRNSGDVQAVAAASNALRADASARGDASALVNPTRLDIVATAGAVGLGVGAGILGGSLDNSGDILAAADADVRVGVTAHAGGERALANLAATGDTLSILASAYAYGVVVAGDMIGGDVVNSGDVTALAAAHVAVDVSASAVGDGVARFRAAGTSEWLAVSASASAYGVMLGVDQVAGDVRNSGAIHAHADAGVDVHVAAHGTGSAEASVSSTDYAYFTARALAFGISAAHAVSATLTRIGGDLANAGDLTVTANGVVHVAVRADAGTGHAQAYIESHTAALYGNATATAYGIAATITSIGGDLANAGDLDILANAGFFATVTAIAESGSATARLGAQDPLSVGVIVEADGIQAAIGVIDGDFANSGDIEVAGFGTIGVSMRADSDAGPVRAAASSTKNAVLLTATVVAYGITLEMSQALGGSFENSGAVTALANAAVLVDLSADALGGNAVATLYAATRLALIAEASASGLSVHLGPVGGDITNSGDVLAAALATVGIHLTAAATAGTAFAQLQADDEIVVTAHATAVGFRLTAQTSVGGDVANTGHLDAIAQGAVVIALSAHGSSGGTAAIMASAYMQLGADVSVTGGYIHAPTVHGSVSNSGAVDALARATLGITIAADGGHGLPRAYISQIGDALFISANAKASGLRVSVVGDLDEDFDNSGRIDAQASASLAIDIAARGGGLGAAAAFIRASGTIYSTPFVRIDASATAAGLDLNVQHGAGDVRNSGQVDALALASLEVAILAEGDGAAAVAYISSTQSGVDLNAEASAFGFDAEIGALDGDFINAGDIEAIARAVVTVALTAYSLGGGGASALIRVGGENGQVDLRAYVSMDGLEVDIGSLGGDFSNLGAIDARGAAAIDLALTASGSDGASAEAFLSAGRAIEITASADVAGLDIGLGSVGGDVTNAGAVDVSAIADLDVTLSAYAGPVASGSFRALAFLTAPGIRLNGHASATGVDLSVDFTGAGDIANTGDVRVQAAAAAQLTMDAEGGGESSSFAYVSATTYVQLSASAYAQGVRVDVADFGEVGNSGDIVVAAQATLGIDMTVDGHGDGNANAYIVALTALAQTHPQIATIHLSASARALGFQVDASGTGGKVGNSGAIDVAALAGLDIALAAASDGASARAHIYGSGDVHIRATATATGVLVGGTQAIGDVASSGDIESLAQASIALDLHAVGAADAEAFVSSDKSVGITAAGLARGLLVVVQGQHVGAVGNSGDLDASALGQVAITLVADAGSGGAFANLFATSSSVAVRATAHASGLQVVANVADSVDNSGAIDVAARATIALDFAATTSDGTRGAFAYMSAADGAVLVTASALAWGFDAGPTTVGTVSNTGDIDARALGSLDLDFAATGYGFDAVAFVDGSTQVRLAATAQAVGMLVGAKPVSSISNAGAITAFARADLTLALHAEASGGLASVHISASGALSIVADASAYGIRAGFTTLGGGFDNSGDIQADAVAHLDLRLDASGNASVGGSATLVEAMAHAYGISIVGTTIGGDVSNGADVSAHAFASSYVSGVDGGVSHTAAAMAVGMLVGLSGTVGGDVVNSGRLAAFASAYAWGTGAPRARATAIGLDVDMDVTGDVVNSGTIVASASADSAYAYGIRVIGHAVNGSIQNTGIIAAFADGDAFTEAFAIQLREADGPTVIEQLDGFIIGDINLDNTVDHADTIEFSGGEIRGGIFGDGPAAGDELVAFRGADATLNITGDISGLQSINVNPFSAPASSFPDVELRIGGDVTNTGSLNVNAHGTLVVGLFSDISVINYRQVPTGTTLFEVNAGGENGTIFPDNVSLAGTVGIRPAPGLYADNQTYVVIDSPNLIGSTYDNVRSTALLQVDDDYSTPTEVHLNVTRIAFDAVGGLTHNQTAVGGALEADYGDIDPNSDFGAVVGSLFGLIADQYREALTDLAGAEHAQMLKIGAGSIQSIDNALMGRLAFVRGLSAEQLASVDGVGMAFAQVASTGDVDLHVDLAQAEAQQVANPGSSGIWARVFGGTSTLEGDDEAPGFDTDNGGVSVGIDHRLSPDAIVGLYGGYAHADASFDTDADGSVDTYQVGVYGSWASGGVHVDGMVSGAWQNYELKRSIDFLGRRASSDYDGWAIGASAQVGYDIALGSAAVIEPMAGLDYIHLETDGFSEDGADSVDLNVESGEFDSLKSSLGVRITAQIDAGDGMVLIPTASVAWEHEFLDAKGEFTASFDGSPNGTTFDIVGSDDEADAAAISLGLALTSDNMTAFVGYDGKISGDGSAHQGTIGIRFGF